MSRMRHRYISVLEHMNEAYSSEESDPEESTTGQNEWAWDETLGRPHLGALPGWRATVRDRARGHVWSGVRAGRPAWSGVKHLK